MGLFTRRKTKFVDSDILIVGGGMGGCGCLQISILGAGPEDHLRREGEHRAQRRRRPRPVGDQLYMGMQWGENQPEDFVRYARNDLMGLVREDLGYDIARHVDSTVHKFEEWGLPIMRDRKPGGTSAKANGRS